MLYLITIFIFTLGLIIGSFLNCLIWRLHKNEGIMNRSYCPKCSKMIAWLDNIPIFSYLMLRGKCRHCKKAISLQYPVVELVTGILFLLAWQKNIGFNNMCYELCVMSYVNVLRDWFLISVMIVVFIYDLRWYLILDIVTLPACALVFILNLFLGFTWLNLLISGIIGGSFFLIQYVVSKGKWIGGGDIRLGLLIGFALGWPNIVVAIILGYFIGSIIGIGLMLAGRKKWGSKLPLGVFLAVSTIITLFWGNGMVEWYMDIFLFR